MTEWELMTEIAKANNQGNNVRLAELILDNDFTDKSQAATIAISSFQLTKENAITYQDAARKLAELPEPKAFRESLRQDVLKGIIDESRQSVTKE
jgi:hypothetical protein